MADSNTLFYLILVAIILTNTFIFILVYLRFGDKKNKPKAKTSSVTESKETQKCSHFLGYLADKHPRNQTVPEECFGCKAAMECMNKQEKEKLVLAHRAPEKEGRICDDCSSQSTVKCVVCGKKRCKKHADIFEIVTKKKAMQLYMCLRCRNCHGYVCNRCYEQKSSFFGGIALYCKKCGQKLSIEPISLSELGDRWNEAELSKFEISVA